MFSKNDGFVCFFQAPTNTSRLWGRRRSIHEPVVPRFMVLRKLHTWMRRSSCICHPWCWYVHVHDWLVFGEKNVDIDSFFIHGAWGMKCYKTTNIIGGRAGHRRTQTIMQWAHALPCNMSWAMRQLASTNHGHLLIEGVQSQCFWPWSGRRWAWHSGLGSDEILVSSPGRLLNITWLKSAWAHQHPMAQSALILPFWCSEVDQLFQSRLRTSMVSCSLALNTFLRTPKETVYRHWALSEYAAYIGLLQAKRLEPRVGRRAFAKTSLRMSASYPFHIGKRVSFRRRSSTAIDLQHWKPHKHKPYFSPWVVEWLD